MKKILFAILAGAVSINLCAQNAMDFLNITPDAASYGVAGTSVARGADAYAIENNMAAASLSESTMDVALGYAIWNPQNVKTGIISASGFYKFGEKFSLGVGFKNFTEPSYDITSAEGRIGSSYTPKEMAVSVGASYRIIPSLSVGLDVKYASSALAENAKASSVAADISLAFSSKGFTAGLSANNIGSKPKYGEYSYSLPMMFKGGVGYSIAGFTASAEADYIMNSGFMAGIGAEYLIVNIVAVRAGYHYGAEKTIPSYASVGLGVKFIGIELNATYLLASKTLGNTLLFGLGYSF